MERGGQSLYYNTDALGSVVDLRDSNGNLVQSYVYDSFGNIEQQVGSMENPYTYTSREFDSESGLYYYRARYYDRLSGRFLNEDPIGFEGEINFYVYVRNNPVNFRDPLGLKTIAKEILDIVKEVVEDADKAAELCVKHFNGKSGVRLIMLNI